jgi:hypothetical protein
MDAVDRSNLLNRWKHKDKISHGPSNEILIGSICTGPSLHCRPQIPLRSFFESEGTDFQDSAEPDGESKETRTELSYPLLLVNLFRVSTL